MHPGELMKQVCVNDILDKYCALFQWLRQKTFQRSKCRRDNLARKEKTSRTRRCRGDGLGCSLIQSILRFGEQFILHVMIWTEDRLAMCGG